MTIAVSKSNEAGQSRDCHPWRAIADGQQRLMVGNSTWWATRISHSL